MVLPNGRRPWLDMFGVNPYTERPLDMTLPHRAGRLDFNDLDWLVRQLDRYRRGDRSNTTAGSETAYAPRRPHRGPNGSRRAAPGGGTRWLTGVPVKKHPERLNAL
jgi:hypothetical protein